MQDSYQTIEFVIDGEPVESISGDMTVPSVGEHIEIGGRFNDDGFRLDPGIHRGSMWRNSSYETILEGDAVDVRRHYHNAPRRTEQTIYVELENVEQMEYEYLD